MNFYQLLQQLEDRLGYHQLPLSPGATGIRDIFDGTPLHHDWMVQLVRAIYAENGCRNLTDPVQRPQTFKALAVLRQQALRASATDIELRTLVEEIGEILNEIFTELAVKAAPVAPTDAPASADIISFESARRRPKP
jgi:hypothetical protein